MHSSSCLQPSSITASLVSLLSSLCLCVCGRAVASVLQGGCPGEQYRGEEALGMHSQHFVSRATNLREWFFFFSSKYILDTSLLGFVEQHKEVWVGCVSAKKKVGVRGPYEVIWSVLRMQELLIPAGLYCFKNHRSYLADGA